MYAKGLVNIYCKLQGITLSHNKTHLDPCESLFFHAKAAGVHKKPTSILMQLNCTTFRPLFLENIYSCLLRNQMIMMLISHFRYILNAPMVFHHIPFPSEIQYISDKVTWYKDSSICFFCFFFFFNIIIFLNILGCYSLQSTFLHLCMVLTYKWWCKCSLGGWNQAVGYCK